MKKQILNFVAAGLLCAASTAHSEILLQLPTKVAYDAKFSFTGLEGSVTKDFGFNFIFEVSDELFYSGFYAVQPQQSTAVGSLGYDVAYAAQWRPNLWVFDDVVNEVFLNFRALSLDDNSFYFNVSELTSPGTSTGMVLGLVGGESFTGSGTLTLTQIASDVPEPMSIALFAVGGAAMAYRRRSRRQAK